MELCDRFNSDVWETSQESLKGFVNFAIVRPQCEGPGKFKYAIREIRDDETDCKMDMVTLDGGYGKMDPLASIRNCALLVTEGKVVGVRIEDECVVKKNLIQ